MSNKKYVKLGEKASIFSDPVSGLLVGPGDVVGIEVTEISRKVKGALAGGHLVYATFEESPDYVPTAKLKASKKDIMKMDEETLLEFIKAFGFDDDDLEKIAEAETHSEKCALVYELKATYK